ncbi:ribosome rescue protein RqcH [Methanolapillus ohkumae]
MKQEMTSADVSAIVAELSTGGNSLIDGKIEKIYQTAENEIRINLYIHKRGRDDLIIESGKRLHLSKYLKESPKIPQGFPMLLRKHIMGGRITFIEQHQFDRIVKIGIIRGGEETILVAELFSRGNIILLDKNEKIILPFKPVTFKDRRIRSGETYELPAEQYNPLKTSVDEIKMVCRDSDKDIIRTLANNFNLGGLYSEEVFKRCAVDKSKPAKELTDAEFEQIHAAISEMLAPIQSGNFKPALVLKEIKNSKDKKAETDSSSISKIQTMPQTQTTEPQTQTAAPQSIHQNAIAPDASVSDTAAQKEEKPAFVLPDGFEIFDVVAFDLVQYKAFSQIPMASFSEALDETFGKASLNAIVVKKEEVKHEKKLGVYERRLKQQTETMAKFDREIEKNTKIAETIYAHYSFIESVLSVFSASREKGYSWDEIIRIINDAKKEKKNDIVMSIVSIQPADASVTLDLKECKAVLDIRKTIPQNANVYYDAAKKFMKKKEGAKKAILDTQAALDKKDKDKDKKSASTYVLKRKKHWYDRFKWFYSSDGFLVVGGRDSDTNEEIFKKYMEKRDLVFHTQMPGAPLTVIKTEGREVPPTTLMEAATFAVSHSSLWKGKKASGDCYMIKAEQVSKTPESGEYVTKGSFIIRGERQYFNDVALELAVGLELDDETRIIGGPISAVKARAKHVIEVIPGKFNQNDLSKKIYRLYMNEVKDQKFLKQISSPDLIAMAMPPGESDIRSGPDGKMPVEESGE